jgi:ABC-2 type transport system permease protein
LIYTLIPAGFMTHFPVTLIRDFDVSYAGLLVVVTFLWVVTAKLFFSAGLRRYESGNLVAPRQ